MKKSIHSAIIFVFICYSTIAFAQNRSINFEKGTWDEIRKKSDAENKIIFVTAHYGEDLYYEGIKKNVFTNDKVADFYNKNFICWQLDLEKVDMPLFELRFTILGGLTYLFLNDDEVVLHRDYEARTVSDLIAVGQTALNPETRFGAWQEKYRNGNREPSFIRQYIKMLRPTGPEVNEVADWYFAAQKNEDLLTKENFEMIKEYVYKASSPTFQYLVSNRAEFRKLSGADEVDKKIFDVYDFNVQTCHIFFKPDGSKTLELDEKRFQQLKEEIKKSGFERSEELLMHADVWYYGEKRDAKKYAEAAVPYINKYRINNYKDLNYTAWYFYAHEEISDPFVLNQALGWAKKCVDNQPSPAAYDTYASLLYKLKKKNEALKAIQTSIDMRTKAGENTTNSKYLLDKITAMK